MHQQAACNIHDHANRDECPPRGCPFSPQSGDAYLRLSNMGINSSFGNKLENVVNPPTRPDVSSVDISQHHEGSETCDTSEAMNTDSSNRHSCASSARRG